MTEYSSQILSPDKLCRTKFPVISKLHDYLRSNNSKIDMDFSEYFPHLTICKPTETYKLAPPILLMGKQSDQRKLFERYYGDKVFDNGRTPDPNLEKLAAYGYEYAYENGSFCQECEALVRIPDGFTFVPFVRYMAKYEDPGGRTLIAYAATLLNRTLQ